MTTLTRDGKGKLKLQIIEADTKSGSIAIIGPVRLSHLCVFELRENKMRKCVEYSLVALIEKTDTEMLKFVRERLQHSLVKVFGKPIAKYDTCLKDGDVEIDKDGKPKYPGHMYIATRADNDQPPVVLSPKSIPLDRTSNADWVSGDWGYVKFDFFGYDNEKTGVGTRLKAVQFSAKGIPFGRAPQDKDEVAGEFGAVEGVEEPAAEDSGSFLD